MLITRHMPSKDAGTIRNQNFPFSGLNKFKINFRNDGKVRLKCSVEIKGKEVKGGGISNSIEQADILCLIFLHAIERDLQAVNQNRI